MPESSQLERDDVAAWTAARDAVIADRHCWDREALQSERARGSFAAVAMEDWQQERPPSDQMITAAVVSSKALLGQIVQEELPERLLRKPPVQVHPCDLRGGPVGDGHLGRRLVRREPAHRGRFKRQRAAPPRRSARRRRAAGEDEIFSRSPVACVAQILDEAWIAARCAPNPIIAGDDALGANFLFKSRGGPPCAAMSASERAVEACQEIGEQEFREEHRDP